MEIRANNCMNTFNTSVNNDFSKTHNECKPETESKPASKTDTITISAAGKQFVAEKKEIKLRNGYCGYCFRFRFI